MKRGLLYGLCVISVYSTSVRAEIKENNLKLFYDEPAKEWTEALPVGNGHLGAMIFGGVKEEKIQFNEATLYVGEPRDYSRPGASTHLGTIRQLVFDGKQKEAESLAMKEFMSDPITQMPYQPFADIELSFSDLGDATDYQRELDLNNAVARTTFKADGVTYTREVIASYPDKVIAVRISADQPGKLTFTAGFKSPHKGSKIEKSSDHEIRLFGKLRNNYQNKRPKTSVKISNPLRFEARMQGHLNGGTMSVANGKLSVQAADAVTLLIVADTSYVNFQDVSGDPTEGCKAIMTAVENRDWDAIKSTHTKDYQELFNRVSIDLGSNKNPSLPTDDRLERAVKSNDSDFAALLFQYGRYLLISSSRPGGQPANLQGIWNDRLDPPWGSRYTVNINTEMNYWPAELTNLMECHEPLLRSLEELAVSGARTAKNLYNARGWVIHHNFDLWRGTAPINGADHGIWVTGGAWLCQHLWWRYQYQEDPAFLERAYPLMKGAAQFCADFLQEDPRNHKGWLISTPSHSPEHGGLVAGPSMDHQIIRNLFSNVISASEILDRDAEFRTKLEQLKSRIAPNQIGKHGQLQEWLEDKDDIKSKHRHVSHLWGLHPGKEINWKDTPDLFQAAQKSLKYRGDAATGWSMGWKVNFWARFLDGDHANLILNNLVQPPKKRAGGLYPNLLDAHPPFQIDGNFGVTSGIVEMIMQNHLTMEDNSTLIHLLPALPKEWSEGSITGLCARGQIELDLEWNANTLREAKLLSKKDQTITVLYKDAYKKLSLEANKPLVFKP